jgi:hypothetical protein
MGARHGNSPGRRIRRGRSGRGHCSSGLCWPVMHREDQGGTRGGPDRALSACWLISGTGPELGFCWWQVLGSNQRRLSRRFYRRTSFTAVWPADVSVHAFGAFGSGRRSVHVPRRNLNHLRWTRRVDEQASPWRDQRILRPHGAYWHKVASATRPVGTAETSPPAETSASRRGEPAKDRLIRGLPPG